MSRMVHEFSSPVERESGRAYAARVRGDEDHTGQWTHLRDADAAIRVEKRDVPAEPHALVTALTGAG